jgi:hypothetical protein
MKKTLAAALIAGAATAALMGAGTAQADGVYTAQDRLYLKAADNVFNINVNSAPQAIRWAHAACTMMDRGYAPVTVASAMDALPEFREVPTRATGYLVGAAIGAYCPWHE